MNVRSHLVRRLATLGASVAAAIALSVTPAHATITNMTAALSCSSGSVRAYPPSPYTTYGTNAWANISTKADLYVYTSRGWQYAATSGWWANGATNNTGHLGSANGQYWVTNGGMGAIFTSFRVTPGYYYSVVTYAQDKKDGKVTYVTNHLDASNTNSGTYCAA